MCMHISNHVLPTQKLLIRAYQILQTDTYLSYVNLTHHFMYFISWVIYIFILYPKYMISIDTPCKTRVQDLDLFLNLVNSLMMA
jgi:hypothetical protein